MKELFATSKNFAKPDVTRQQQCIVGSTLGVTNQGCQILETSQNVLLYFPN